MPKTKSKSTGRTATSRRRKSEKYEGGGKSKSARFQRLMRNRVADLNALAMASPIKP